MNDKGTLYVAEGDEIDMRCQNRTGGTFANLVWLSNAYASEGKKAVYSLTAAGEDYIKPSYEDRVVRFNGTSIRIKNVRSEDSGNYECNIVFKIKKLKVEMLAVYDVVVITPPSVIKSDKTLVSGLRGESLEVYCEVQALSPFNVTWIKTIGNINFNNTQFTEMQHETLDRSSSKNIYIKRSKMTISNLTDENTGRYRCVAYNLGGHRYTIVHVRMKSKPKVVSENHVKINVSDDGDLFCQAKGFPVIYFKWKFYNRNNLVTLSPSDDYNSRFQVSHSVYDSHSEVGSSKLQLTNVQKEDYQTYTCIAENSVGRAEHSIKLDGCAPPDPPTISGSDLRATTDSVTLRWEYGDSGKNPVTSVTIKYRNSTDETWTKIQIHQHIREYVVTNLQENTMYEFKIQASNAVGPSKYSKVVRKPTDSSLLDTTSDDSNGRPILDDLDTPTLIAILGGTFIALLIAFICVCVFMKRINKSDQNEVVNQNSSSIAGATSLHTQHYSIDGGVPPTIHMEMESLINNPADDWEFPRDRLQTATVLGSGAFGIVMKGVAQGIKGSLGQVTVAVKMVRDHTNDIATKDLIGELNLLKLIPEHPNVVGLLGCCTRSQPFYVIVEYCANGDLQGFLRSSRGIYERYYWSSYGGAVPNLTAKMLLTFAWQITKGMSHLAGMKVIHRDLAARNILVDDQLVCKISDFGFARDTYLEDHYLKRSTGGRFPIKWMAIESLLDSISTTKSDVWSYGVVLWELVTLGASPYPGMNSYEVVSFLQDGYRMDKPKHCSNELYLLMMDCWNVSPGRRPSFNELAERCQQLVESSDVTEYISMNYYQEHMYINFDVNGSFLSVAGVSNSATPRSTLNRRLDAHLTANGRERSTSGDMIPPRQSRSLSISSNGRFATNPTPNVCLTPRTPKKSVPLPPNRSSSITSRSNSITALSERSATATSSASNSNENSTLLGTVDS